MNTPAQSTPQHAPSGAAQTPPVQGMAQAAGSTLNDAKRQGEAQFEQVRERATEQIESLADSAQSAAAALEGKDSLGLSQYLNQLATGLGGFAERVRDKSAEDLLHEGARLARDNPALFVAGSVAIGFGLSRFLRASASHDDPGTGTASANENSPARAPSADGDTAVTQAEPRSAAAPDPTSLDGPAPLLDSTVRGFD